MPWLPELFSAPALERIAAHQRHDVVEAVPYFSGLMAGETDALISSFAGEPELHHPILGRVKGVRAIARFATHMDAWLAGHKASVEEVDRLVTPRRTVEEVVLHTEHPDGARVDLPVAIVADRDESARLHELRIYFSNWPIGGRHAIRPPLLQADPDVHEDDIIGEYQRALAAGDVEGVVSTFQPSGYVREPAGGRYIHRGTGELRALFGLFFSRGGGIPLEHCTATDNGTACAVEYNVVAWGDTSLPPQAGVAVYVRGDHGKLASARIYDDADPPLA